MNAHCSMHCKGDVELDITPIVRIMYDGYKSNPIHLHHDIEDYQWCGPPSVRSCAAAEVISDLAD